MKMEMEMELEDVSNERSAPCVYLSIPAGQVKMLEGLKVGAPVIAQIRGTVKAVGQHEDYEQKDKAAGTLELEISKLKVEKDSANEFAELAAED